MDDDNVTQMPGTVPGSHTAAHDAARMMAGMYQKLLVEGFTAREALYLVASMATGGPKDPPS